MIASIRSGGHSWPWDAPAAEIVDARAEHQTRAVGPELHPRRLDARDPRVEGQARGRVQCDRLVEGRAVARLALQCDWCLLGHEWQRHELGEAARLAL
jgi:hypothetical protein